MKRNGVRLANESRNPDFLRDVSGGQAAFCSSRSSRLQISTSAAVRLRLIASSFVGPGVKLRRSVPLGSVGNLLGCTFTPYSACRLSFIFFLLFWSPTLMCPIFVVAFIPCLPPSRHLYFWYFFDAF